MFKIGDFSKLSQVSVKTLRYYDEIGLLKPVQSREMYLSFGEDSSTPVVEVQFPIKKVESALSSQ